MQEHSLFSIPSPAFIVCRLLDDGHSVWCEVISHCSFDLHFSNNEWCWASLHVFISHLYVFVGEIIINLWCKVIVCTKLYIYIYTYIYVLVVQLCLTLCNPKDCSSPGSPLHGILQTRILKWVAMLSSRGSSWPRDWTRVSHIAYIYVCVCVCITI